MRFLYNWPSKDQGAYIPTPLSLHVLTKAKKYLILLRCGREKKKIEKSFSSISLLNGWQIFHFHDYLTNLSQNCLNKKFAQKMNSKLSTKMTSKLSLNISSNLSLKLCQDIQMTIIRGYLKNTNLKNYCLVHLLSQKNFWVSLGILKWANLCREI